MAANGINQAVQFLDYYLNDEKDAEYAVMLSAPWGAGKTHFIKQYLDERSHRMGEDQKPCYLYASLYGVTSTAAISDQFFAQIHPHLSSKASRVIGSVAANFIDKLSGTKNSDQLVRDMLLKLEGKILVIDDLERCSMKIADVMGFINTFVEHEGLKVIILVNESDIPTDQRPVYDRQKEKLVGKTIEVISDPEEVLEKLTARIKSTLVKELVTREKSALLNTFSASGKSNFRNLRAVLADYERLVGAIDERLSGKAEALKQLLLYMIATGNEFRSGELSAEMLKLLPTTNSAVARLYSNATKAPSVNLFEKLSSRYPEVKWTDPIVNPKHLAELYSAGMINVAEINKGIGQHPEVVGHGQIPAWRLLWNFSQLSQPEYSLAKADLLAELANHQIVQPGVILHVAGIAISLRNFDEHILGVDIEPEEYFKNYVLALLEQNALVMHRGTFAFDALAGVGLGYSSADTPEFQAIYTMVKQASKDIERKQIMNAANAYVSRLKSDPNSYHSLFEHGVHDENYGGIAMLHHIAASDFASLLIVDSQSNDDLFASLIKRYEHDFHRGAPLKDEYEWLCRLKDQLLMLAESEVAPFRKILVQRVTYYFERLEDEIGGPSA